MKVALKDAALLIVVLAFYWVALSAKENDLKREINTAVALECTQNVSAPIITKYNTAIGILVNQQLTAYRLNLKIGDTAKAAADATYATQLQDTEIALGKTDCSQPFLR